MLEIDLNVIWPDDRSVQVHVRGVPTAVLLGREDIAEESVALLGQHVMSKSSLEEYLEDVTRVAVDKTVVSVVGLEPDVLKIFRLLRINGVPHGPIDVKLPVA
jgi:hypothetical protein